VYVCVMVCVSVCVSLLIIAHQWLCTEEAQVEIARQDKGHYHRVDRC